MIAGYSAGKSFSIVAFVLMITQRYNGSSMVCGIGSPTITFFRKTILIDLEKTLIESGIRYRWNAQSNELMIGTIKWIVISLDQPKLIFGYNFSIFCADEIEEMPIDKCIEAYGAIQERTRIPLPDGRKPFSIFTTTSQGMRGCYSITENLKDKKIPFAIIRASTRDNTNLDPEYYQRLYSLYTETERLVYLEGAFLNLQAGRVYPSYNEQENSVDDFEILPDDEIHIGQDLNIASSCATAIIKRNKILYVIKCWQFKDFAQSANLIRQDFPMQNIYLYPDASGRMIIDGYLAEYAHNDINVVTNTTNPPVIERIFLVNKMLSSGRLKRFKSVKQIDMCWKTRIYDENGNPSKSKIHPSDDDVADGMEYSHQRILSNDPDFYDLYSLTRSFQKNK
jgi:hypothetical protein